ncbi:selenocysteine lyase isoform X1 [Hydra vulgaris]|uniref:selenocysteine lyase isoform X1 n=1 Tax=Hydra vulgaris TaxID=6087 RepID=UPI000192526E|nr:selenocysteine lyase isoform X1 [Hydra vulgaris]
MVSNVCNEQPNSLQNGNDMQAKVYMDYNATTPLAPTVAKEIQQSLFTAWGNPSSSHSAGVQAKLIISKARENLRKMLNSLSSNEIFFMSGGTEANNHVIHSTIKYFKECFNENTDRKPHVISSVIEHDSIIKPLLQLEKEGCLDLTLVGVCKHLGHVDPDEIFSNVQDNTVLVTIMMAHNETGAIQPIKEISSGIKKINEQRVGKSNLSVFVHTDAAQAIGKIKVDVQELGVDYLTVVGHKFYGPKIGALWVHSLCPLNPMLYGGGQEKGKRPGTENVCMIAGLGEAARLVSENLNVYEAHFKKMKGYLKFQLDKAFSSCISYNEMPCATLSNTLNISITSYSLNGREVLNRCKFLLASVGAACHSENGESVSASLLAHGITEEIAKRAIRLSLGRDTSENDIDIIVSDLRSVFV